MIATVLTLGTSTNFGEDQETLTPGDFISEMPIARRFSNRSYFQSVN
jgi:hypothetical protein